MTLSLIEITAILYHIQLFQTPQNNIYIYCYFKMLLDLN